MDQEKLLSLLSDYKRGAIDDNKIIEALKKLPFEDLGFAKVDHHRALRQGYPEVIFCQNKAPEQAAQIAQSIVAESDMGLLATRAGINHFEAIRNVVPDAVYYEIPRIVTVCRKLPPSPQGLICVVSAGTSDMPVSEEAAITAEMLGNRVERVYDVGVAGIHRLLANVDRLNAAAVIIAVAGMEGALPSVLGGLTDKPIIAVPTSIGYGASFGGLSALLTMLNSCASGIGVVNIDNGFGAAWLASRINHLTLK